MDHAPAVPLGAIPTPARIALTEPDVALHADWLAAAAEFAVAGQYQHGSGLTPDGDQPRLGSRAWRPAELTDPGAFADFVAHLRSLRRETFVQPPGMVPDDKLWITSDDTGGRRYLGTVSLRHELNEFLLAEGGHIGYSVRPSMQGRGIATRALRLTLERARELGLDRVLITCESSNPASAAVIERHGGALDDVRGVFRRYWVDLR